MSRGLTALLWLGISLLLVSMVVAAGVPFTKLTGVPADPANRVDYVRNGNFSGENISVGCLNLDGDLRCTWPAGGGGNSSVSGNGSANRLAIWSSTDVLTSNAALTFVNLALIIQGRLNLTGSLNASAVYVNGVSVCLENGTNCPTSGDGTGGWTNTSTTTSTTLNVGIGTTAPTQKLEVNGSANVSGTVYANGYAVCQSDGTNCLTTDNTNYTLVEQNNRIYNLTAYNNPTYNEQDGSFAFTGNSENYMQSGYSLNLSTPYFMCVEATRTEINISQGMLIGWGNGGNGLRFAIDLLNRTTAAIYNSTGGQIGGSSSIAKADNTTAYSQYCFGYTGSNLIYCVNGVCNTGNNYTGVPNVNYQFRLAQGQGTTYGLNGSIRDVRVWNRSLATYEVISAYNGDDVACSSLQLWYPFSSTVKTCDDVPYQSGASGWKNESNVVSLESGNNNVSAGRLYIDNTNNKFKFGFGNPASITTKFAVNLSGNDIAQLSDGTSASGIWGTNIGLISTNDLGIITTPLSTTPIAFYTGGSRNTITPGTERMRLTGDGNLSIGTTAATQKLNVNGSVNVSAKIYVQDRIVLQQGTSGINVMRAGIENSILFQNTSDVVVLRNPNNNVIIFQTNGVERVRFDAGGLVGINTSSPTTTLDVSGTFRSFVSGVGDVRISHSGLVTTIASASSVNLSLGAGGTTNKYLNIRGNGDIGIGTTAPTQKLDVNGSINVSSQAYFYSNITLQSPNGSLWNCGPSNTGVWSCS